MRTDVWVGALLLTLGVFGADRSATAQQPPAERERFHIFILAGQSNMAGRGTVEARDSVTHPRVWMLDKELRWVPAVDPMHFDKPIAGVGPGRSFGVAVADADPTIHVGLVPAAVGGSSIRSWIPGGVHEETGAHPWDDAILRARAASLTGELKGILWHQGESDSNGAASVEYAANLRSLIERFRETLKEPNLPFLIGQLGRFEGRPWGEGQTRVDAAHRAMESQMSQVRYVSADGLEDNGDGIHFSASAAREFGLRYAEVFQRLREIEGDAPSGRP